jgi:ssDNA-binding Zn-finger/Zn-ribbon topoisomerase 1
MGELSSEQGVSTPVAPDPAKLTVKEMYTCPMHPEVIKKKAGKCPKCGMNLEKKEFYEVYACPMADCPHMSEKGGKCSTCGMKLKKKLVSKEEYQDLTFPQMTYTCPMHPEVSSDKPGNCPKCGMKLEMEKTISPE